MFRKPELLLVIGVAAALTPSVQQSTYYLVGCFPSCGKEVNQDSSVTESHFQFREDVQKILDSNMDLMLPYFLLPYLIIPNVLTN